MFEPGGRRVVGGIYKTSSHIDRMAGAAAPFKTSKHTRGMKLAIGAGACWCSCVCVGKFRSWNRQLGAERKVFTKSTSTHIEIHRKCTHVNRKQIRLYILGMCKYTHTHTDCIQIRQNILRPMHKNAAVAVDAFAALAANDNEL